MNRHQPDPGLHGYRKQRGAVLIVSLVLLLVLTIIAMAATSSTTLEERMVANQRDQQVAFEAAEAALRNGESVLENSTPGQFDNSGYLYNSSSTVTWQTVDWSDSSTQTAKYEGSLPGLPAGVSYPRFYIVETTQSGSSSGQSLAADAPVSGSSIYYVYAEGKGLSGQNQVILASAYQR